MNKGDFGEEERLLNIINVKDISVKIYYSSLNNKSLCKKFYHLDQYKKMCMYVVRLGTYVGGICGMSNRINDTNVGHIKNLFLKYYQNNHHGGILCQGNVLHDSLHKTILTKNEISK